VTRPNTREDAIFLSLWRRAGRGNPPPPMDLGDPSKAITIRAKLYRVTQPYRQGRLDDPDIQIAMEKFAISAKGNIVSFTPRVTGIIAEEIFSSLGMTEMDLMTPEEAASAARMAQFLKPEKD
jgi:hypothetical protein